MKNHDDYTNKLQSFWQAKEYRSFPALVNRYMRQDKAISGNAIICWQAILDRAIYQPNWTIQLSKKELAEELNSSPGSIARYLKDLKATGYLSIKQQKINNVWYSSVITIKLPDILTDLLEQAPNRRKSNLDIKPASNNELPTDPYHNHGKLFHVEQFTTPKTSTKSNQGDNWCDIRQIGALKNSKLFHVEQFGLNADCSKIPSTSQKAKSNGNRDAQIKANPTPNMVKGYDQYDHSNKDNNNLNNNNNTVVNDLKKLKQEANSILLKASTKIDKSEKIRLLDVFSQKDNEIRVLETLQSSIKICTDKAQRASAKPNSYVTRSGARAIPKNLLSTLEQKINGLPDPQKSSSELLNEIAYATRFGGLQVCTKDNKPMSIEHSVNVALKLVREGRWQKPTGMSAA